MQHYPWIKFNFTCLEVTLACEHKYIHIPVLKHTHPLQCTNSNAPTALTLEHWNVRATCTHSMATLELIFSFLWITLCNSSLKQLITLLFSPLSPHVQGDNKHPEKPNLLFPFNFLHVSKGTSNVTWFLSPGEKCKSINHLPWYKVHFYPI